MVKTLAMLVIGGLWRLSSCGYGRDFGVVKQVLAAVFVDVNHILWWTTYISTPTLSPFSQIFATMASPQFRSPEERDNEYKKLFNAYTNTAAELASTNKKLSTRDIELQESRMVVQHLHNCLQKTRKESQRWKRQFDKLKNVIDGFQEVVVSASNSKPHWSLFAHIWFLVSGYRH